MPTTKTKWSKETPKERGWYWMKYAGKHGVVKCPARVERLQDTTVFVRTASNDTFIGGPNHGGPELKCDGIDRDKTIRFGPKIEEPD